MKRRTERIARHSTVLAIVFACVLAFAGVAFSQVVSGTADDNGGSTSASSTSASTTGSGGQGNGKKVQICHFTKSKKHPAHTIWVSKAAEPSFLARGDHEGRCTDEELHPAATTTASTTTTSTTQPKHSKPNHRKGGTG